MPPWYRFRKGNPSQIGGGGGGLFSPEATAFLDDAPARDSIKINNIRNVRMTKEKYLLPIRGLHLQRPKDLSLHDRGRRYE